MNNEMPQSDHDVLVTMKATFDAFVKRYDSDMIQLKDGYTSKITDLDARMKVLEKIVDQVDPIGTFKEFKSLQQEIHDWKTGANILRAMWGAVGAIVVWIVTQIPNILRLTGIIH